MKDIGIPGAPKLELRDRLSTQLLGADTLAPEVRNAIAMHNETIAASNSFHSLFCERYKSGQDPKDLYEQDLLRAMLIFSCSGLDATLKQLVRDALECVIARDIGAHGQFAKYLEQD